MSHWMTVNEVLEFMGFGLQKFLYILEDELIEGHLIEGEILFQRHEVINLKMDIMKRSN